MTKKSSIEKHFDQVAASYDPGKEKYSFYYSSLKNLLVKLIGKNKNVFEFGCGTGDLLSFLDPKVGYGMDISSEMIRIAQFKHKNEKNIFFSTSLPKTKFDYIFMSDVIEHLENPERNFKEIVSLMTPHTKFILTMANPIWEPLLMFWERLGWKMKEGEHKRVAFNEIRLMINDSGMKIIRHDYKLLIPVKIPFITNFANKFLEKPLRKLCFIEYFVASVY